MPSGAYYLLIVAAAGVLVLALWKGRVVKMKFGQLDGEVGPGSRTVGVSVARAAKISDSTVGDIGVVIVRGAAPVSIPTGRVDVLSGAEVNRSHVGDIAVIKSHESDQEHK